MKRKSVYQVLAVLLAILSWQRVEASRTEVAKWVFTTGYEVEKSGTSAFYTPNTLGWSQIANTKWSQTQPYFLPNECALLPEDCHVTVHTSDGKWQVTSSGSNPNYLLRLNTASRTKIPGLISFRMDQLGSPCSPRDSQESSTPQFKSINFSALSFLHSPTLTSIHDMY